MKTAAAVLILFIQCASEFAQLTGKTSDSTITPIVDLRLKGLVGGVKNGKWINVTETAVSLNTRTGYILIGDNAVSETGNSVGVVFDPEVPCDDFYRVELDPDSDSGVAIGASATWNLFPRVPKKLAGDSKAYRQIVKEFLAKQGLSKTKIKIDQVYLIDFDGDRQDEVVICATFYKNGISRTAMAGDYSFVLVRKIFGKNVEEILLEGDFVKKNVEFGAPNSYKISSIADLNGDGKMEIMVFGEYYEGSFAGVFEINGKKAEKVLEAGCGV